MVYICDPCKDVRCIGCVSSTTFSTDVHQPICHHACEINKINKIKVDDEMIGILCTICNERCPALAYSTSTQCCLCPNIHGFSRLEASNSEICGSCNKRLRLKDGEAICCSACYGVCESNDILLTSPIQYCCLCRKLKDNLCIQCSLREEVNKDVKIMIVKILIKNNMDRLNVIVALAQEGYKVWIEEAKTEIGKYVCFEYILPMPLSNDKS